MVDFPTSHVALQVNNPPFAISDKPISPWWKTYFCSHKHYSLLVTYSCGEPTKVSLCLGVSLGQRIYTIDTPIHLRSTVYLWILGTALQSTSGQQPQYDPLMICRYVYIYIYVQYVCEVYLYMIHLYICVYIYISRYMCVYIQPQGETKCDQHPSFL